MLNPEQLAALAEIERQIGIIRSLENPTNPNPDNGIPVINVEGDLQSAINAASNDGVILDLLGREHTRSIVINKPITLRNGSVRASININDLVNITGDNVKLLNFRAIGDGATTKNGIVANGRFLELDNVEVLDIGRPGQETHALITWNGSDIIARNSTFYGGSMAVMAGGAGTTTPNHVPSNISIDNCKLGRPLSWKGRFGCKTIIELKNARNVTVRNSTLENNWQEGPQGHAITLTPSNYDGRSPETTVENVLFDNNRILNVNGGVLAIGYSQHQAERPTLHGRNYRFINNEWLISKGINGGQGALVTLGWEPLDVLFEGNSITSDGDALIRVQDSKIVENFTFRNNPRVITPGTYGVFSPVGIRGIGWRTQFINGLIEGNVFTNAHSIFRANFPLNSYLAA